MSDLNQKILNAHDADARKDLVDLYKQAANQADTTDAECFFLTQAYIFGLETRHKAVPDLHNRLASYGRV